MQEYIHKDNIVFGELDQEGKLVLSLYVSGVVISEEEQRHFQAMINGDAAVALEFALTDILEHRLEYFRHAKCADKDVVDIEEKPLFDKMKLELQAMIKTIEAIEYVKE